MFISFLYLFRATVCPSSGEATVFMIPPCIPDSHLYRITRTKSLIDTDARNMYRKEINILRKIVQQVGFIYKIIHTHTHIICSLYLTATCFGRSPS